jgi:hypothetical protein
MSAAPDAKLTKQPDETAERKILSGRNLPFLAPTRDMSSSVSAGEYVAMLARLPTWTVCVAMVGSVGSPRSSDRGSERTKWRLPDSAMKVVDVCKGGGSGGFKKEENAPPSTAS